MKKIVMSTLLSGALTLGAGVAQAADIYLCAGAFDKTMDSDSAVIPMWGFVDVGSAAAQVPGCGAGATSPGPRLINPDTGAGMVIHLYNDNLPENISVVIPGQNATTSRLPVFFTDGQGRQRVRAFTYEATPNGPVALYGWTSLKPGTFIYQSGSHSALQVQMGLYGGLSQDSGILEAYPGHNYTGIVDLFYSEIDPVIHNAVATNTYGPGLAVTSTIGYTPRYFLLNGSDTPVSSTTTGGGATLLRFFNAGFQSHVPVFNGLTMSMIAEDGNPYNGYTKQQYSVLLAAGQTADALITPAAGTYSFYDRMLNLTNKTAGGAAILALGSPSPAGSLIAKLEVTPAAVDTDGDGILDASDNCTLAVNPGQQDSDADGFGNICDGDLSGDGGQVNITDFSIFSAAFNAVPGDANYNAAADFNSDNMINITDYSIFSLMWGKVPGPAGTLP